MITVENLTKSFAGNVLLDGIGFQINARERVGVVGRNGHGKTTLFKILAGRQGYDQGRIQMPKHYRIGYVDQQLQFSRDTILEEGIEALCETEREQHWKVEKILWGLGFTLNDLKRHPRELSGGFQVRLSLARVLISEPSLLLLDEPTNYLDITAIRWVERFLINWPHELLLITHDRSFMDRIVTHTLGIYRQKVRKLPGDTGKYYAQMAQDEAVYEKTRQKDERRRKEVEKFITRFRAKARLANMVQSRIKTLAKLEPKQKLRKLETLDFSFQEKPFQGKDVFQARELTFGYAGAAPLISGFDLTVRPGDRICIVGNNGQGKTTLLKLLAGALPPQQGDINFHPAVQAGLYEQTNVSHLAPDRTVLEEIMYAGPDAGRQAARDISGAMLFSGDDALKKIRVLSGGEKSRVMLGKILNTPANLLFLDEPTNHLDMETCDALLAALDAFSGALILVTHNEMFLHALARRLVVFQDGRINVFEGGYHRFLEKGGWGDENLRLKAKPADDESETATAPRLSKKERKRKEAQIRAERSRILKPLLAREKKLEDRIEALEKETNKLHRQLADASGTGDGVRIGKLGKALHDCRLESENCLDELEKVTDLIAEKRAAF